MIIAMGIALRYVREERMSSNTYTIRDPVNGTFVSNDANATCETGAPQARH